MTEYSEEEQDERHQKQKEPVGAGVLSQCNRDEKRNHIAITERLRDQRQGVAV